MRGSRKYAIKLHEVVNNIATIEIDPFGELFVHWIPAFARKTKGRDVHNEDGIACT
jgi:hypothetical protein